MSLFAVGDLHLPGGQDKPMNVFGAQWTDHFRQIADSWRQEVGPGDTVLIPGDISWAMRPEEARADLEEIAALPGRKVMIRGNHDYWWNGIQRVRGMLPEGFFALQQDALDLGEAVVCGTRGWMIPTGDAPLEEHDLKIYRREVGRLEAALREAGKLAGQRPVVVMLHYPPAMQHQRTSGFTESMERAGARMCVYGHLHGAGIASAFQGIQGGVEYVLTSCDSLKFRVKKLTFYNK